MAWVVWIISTTELGLHFEQTNVKILLGIWKQNHHNFPFHESHKSLKMAWDKNRIAYKNSGGIQTSSYI